MHSVGWRLLVESIPGEASAASAGTAQGRAHAGDRQAAYWIINDGVANRCAKFTVRHEKQLYHHRFFEGRQPVRWSTTYRAELYFTRVGSRLTTSWKWGGSVQAVTKCGHFVGPGGGPGRFNLKPPTCGAPMVVKTCSGNAWRLAKGSLFLTNKACANALAKNEPAVNMGYCQKRISRQLRVARRPPQFDKAVIDAGARLKALLDKRKTVYWLSTWTRPLCRRWQIKRNAKPRGYHLVRTYRKGKARVTTSHHLILTGLDIFVTRANIISTRGIGSAWSGPEGSCPRAVKAGKGQVQFENALSFFTNRTTCLRAKRAAAKRKTRRPAP